MGLSILIPVFNVNVTSLVRTLAGQLLKTGQEGEIILVDDGSSDPVVSVNQFLQTITGVSFHQLEKNEGRMAARQKLAEWARFDHLLFLDCDSDIIKDDFLANYFELVNKDTPLATGGRVYTAEPPSACELMLHWKYGTNRESRKKNKISGKGAAFMSNNFLIRTALFKQLSNSILLTGYGHEDSWWGIRFEQLGIPCIHIDNPVLHGALEKADAFLIKSENAVANLLLLEGKIGKELLSRHVKIFRWYCRLKAWGLAGLYLFIEKPFHNYFRKNLLSCKPNLVFFDGYRLAVLTRLSRSAV